MSKFSYFTNPYPGEIIYSALARLQRNLGISGMQLSKLVFKKAIYTENPIFLNSLECISEEMEGYGLHNLINFHTTAKYETAFFKKEDQDEFIRKISGKHIIGSIFKRNLDSDFLRYCPRCAELDIELFGEPYFHTEHQLTFIPICPICKAILINYSIEDKKNYIYLDKDRVRPFCNSTNNYISLYPLAEMAFKILEVDSPKLSKEIVIPRLRHELMDKGYIKGKGLDYALVDDLKKAYPLSPEELLMLGIAPDNLYDQVVYILNISRIIEIEPIVYLMLIHFLATDIETFLSINPLEKNEKKPPKTIQVKQKTVAKHKKFIEDKILENQSFSRNDLVRCNIVAYNCIIKKDRKWLDDTLPVDVYRNFKDNDDGLDQNVREMLELEYEKIILGNKRVSLSLMSKADLMFKNIKEYPAKYPISISYMESILETQNDYYKRIIRRAIDELIVMEYEISPYQIRLATGVEIRGVEIIKKESINYFQEKGFDLNRLNVTGKKRKLSK